jgi:CubicO group peptidase (beta-lactamase class C family)
MLRNIPKYCFHRFIIVLAGSVFFGRVCAQGLPDSLVRKIDSICGKWAKPSGPGCAVGVVRNDSLIFARGYGMADLEFGVPITDSTIFHMASVSKQFTAFSIVLLERAGKLRLDDDVRKYLPWFPDLKTKITIRNLLNHTSGIRDQWTLLAIQGTRIHDVITQHQIVKILQQQRALNFPVGSEFGYSNSNFTLAAEIVKTVSGQSLRRFTDSAIFVPLGMLHTHFHDDYTEIVKNRAYSYSSKDSAHYANNILSYSNVGATSLFTNVDDMAKWLSNFYLHKVGDQADIDTLTRKGRLKNGKGLELGYALGITTGDHNGWREFSHGGADAGYRTFVAVYPDAKTGVIAFGNIEDFDPNGVAARIADLFLKDKTANGKPATQAPKDTADAVLAGPDIAALKPYLGSYVSADGVAFDLAVRNGKLYYVEEDGPQLLAKDSTGRYVMFDAREVQFTLEPPGRDTEVRVNIPGRQIRLIRYTPVNEKDSRVLQTYVGNYYCPELGCSYGIAIKDHRLVLTNNKYDDAPLRMAGPDHLLDDDWWMNHLTIKWNAAHKVVGFEVNSDRVAHLAFKKMVNEKAPF